MEVSSSSVDIRELNERIHQNSAFIDLLTMELNKVVVGQKTMVERLLIGLLATFCPHTVYPRPAACRCAGHYGIQPAGA